MLNLLGFNNVLKINKTLKQNKNANTDQALLNLKSLAKTKLSSNNLREIIKLPEGEEENEWIALHLLDFYNQISMLFGTTTEFCTKDTCSIMSAGRNWEFYWSDGIFFKKPTKLSAPEYIETVLGWVRTQMDDESIFPVKSGHEFPSKSKTTFKLIYKRLARVYSHLYYCHFEDLKSLQLDQILNTSFKHFSLFANEFTLWQSKDIPFLVTLLEAQGISMP